MFSHHIPNMNIELSLKKETLLYLKISLVILKLFNYAGALLDLDNNAQGTLQVHNMHICVDC